MINASYLESPSIFTSFYRRGNRDGEIKKSHKAFKWQSWDVHSSLLIPKSILKSIRLYDWLIYPDLLWIEMLRNNLCLAMILL